MVKMSEEEHNFRDQNGNGCDFLVIPYREGAKKNPHSN
jgi:hypothetical protein